MAGWEWEVEGKKGLLGMEVKKVLAKGKAFGMRKSVAFEGCLGKFSAKENVLFCGKGLLFWLKQGNTKMKNLL